LRIGIFSDVHANIEAIECRWSMRFRLEAVFDKYVCIGDVFWLRRLAQRVLRPDRKLARSRSAAP